MRPVPRRPLTCAALLGLGATWVLLRGWQQPEGVPRRDRCASDGGAVSVLPAGVLNTSPVLSLPATLRVVREYLVVLDLAADSVLHVFHRKTGVWVRSMGRRGRGPGEFDGAWSLDPARGQPPAAWVYDLPLRRLTLVPLLADSGAARSPHRMVRLTDGTVLTEPHWLTADTLVTPGLLTDARLALYDSGGRRIGSLGRPPMRLMPRQPLQAAQARLAHHPDRPVVALADRYVSRIELVDLATFASTAVAGPVAVNADRPIVELDRFAYLDVAATASHIVALFSGRYRRAFGQRAVFGACLHVFRWDGTLETAFRLDTDVLAIAMADEGRIVYALRHDPVPAIVRFSLPIADRVGEPTHSPPSRGSP